MLILIFMTYKYLESLGLWLVDEWSVFGFYLFIISMSVFHHVHEYVEWLYSFCVFLYVIIGVYRFLVFHLDPLLDLYQDLHNIVLLFFGHYLPPLILHLVLHLINHTFILVLHIIQRHDPPIILLHFFLHFFHLLPLFLLNFMKIIYHKSPYQAFSTYYLILVIYKNYLVWCVYSNVTNRLWCELVLVVNVELDDALGAEVERCLAWVSATVVE